MSFRYNGEPACADCRRNLRRRSLQPAATVKHGRSGTLSTVHANSVAQGISRFTTCVLQSGVEMPYRAIKTNIADSLDVVVQIERRPRLRFVSEVLSLRGFDLENDKYDFDPVYQRSRGGAQSHVPESRAG